MTTTTGAERADAVVVGAGPAGSATAAFLAEAGHDVVVVEKDRFPRDKPCGDGLTPRAVRGLQRLGLEHEASGRAPGWHRQRGLRMRGAGEVLELPWPDMDDWPPWSLTARRAAFDETLARHAERRGARLLEATECVGPVWTSRAERRVAGVRVRDADGAEREVRAPVVVGTDGASARLAVGMGLHRRADRPMGVAVRAYHRAEHVDLDVMEGHLELRDADGELLPGYGWVFPLADGRLNVGWGLIDTSPRFRSVRYRDVLERWVAGLPAEWGLGPDTLEGRMRSAALPMGHNRTPMAHRGALLVGDAAGMVNPFNGEGISYAIEAGEMAAETIDEALRRRSDAPLAGYADRVAHAWGGYYALGRTFLRLVGHPEVMRLCTELGMPRKSLMRFVFRAMAHLVEPRGGDATDRVINGLSRLAPAA